MVINSNCYRAFEIKECQELHSNAFRLDALLSVVVMFTCARFMLGFRVSEAYGPTLKMLIMLTKSLGTFMIIWGIVMSLFTFIGMLLFRELKFFGSDYFEIF